MSQIHPILVVDDDPDARKLITSVLNDAGYPAKAADNGKSALYMLTGFTPSLIVLDMMMPEMNGLEFCKQLVRYKITSVPILVVSAISSKASIMRQFSELPFAAKEYIQKPFDPDALVDVVGKMIGPAESGAAKGGEAP
ncbi:response regulator, partial [Candidatus Sumerlaeota bacterium]|nr:response regulator [Candidatus Sumerlaeota bacterium]